MKKLLLIIIAFAIVQTNFSQNFDFENWTSDTVLNLDGYQTMINDNPAYGEMTVIRSTDSYLNIYSLRLQTVLTPSNDTLFGYFANGDPDSGEGGTPTSLFGVDSIIGYYKCDVPVGDTALFLCMAKQSGILTGGGLYPFTGTVSTWTRFSFYVGSPMADSVLIAAASSNAMQQFGIPGSFLMLDNIQLKYSTNMEPIPNYDFELWTDIVFEDLDEWRTSNEWTGGSGISPIVKTLDAQSGMYAVQLTTMYIPQWGDTLNGIITNGYWTQNGIGGGMPYTDTPTGIEFYVKYMPAGADTAFASFQFYKNGAPIAWNGSPFYGIISNYYHFSQVVTLPETPDTLMIAFSAGENPGSELKIDNINLMFPVAVEDCYTIEEVVAFPVPAKDQLNFKINLSKDNNIELCIIDLSGRKLISKSYSETQGENRISVDISELAQGTYIYNIIIGDKTYIKQFVVN